MKRCFAEFLATFIMVFAGTGAIVTNQVSSGAVTHLGISLVFGLVVMAMIYAFGDTSGAQMNPAVTLGLAAAGRMPWADVPGYIIAQLAGAFAASGTLRLLFPENANLGATLPHGSVLQSFVLEAILTAILMLVVLRMTTGAKEKSITAAIAIGAVIALEALFGGPISGASMNPARSLAPAIVSGQWQALWLYPVATILGAWLAVALNLAFNAPKSTS
jgi:aquaporin NIP